MFSKSIHAIAAARTRRTLERALSGGEIEKGERSGVIVVGRYRCHGYLLIAPPNFTSLIYN